MNIILLSGGSGKRLWPLSNEVRSKQFLKIFKKADGSQEVIGAANVTVKEARKVGTYTVAAENNKRDLNYSYDGDKVVFKFDVKDQDVADYYKKEAVTVSCATGDVELKSDRSFDYVRGTTDTLTITKADIKFNNGKDNGILTLKFKIANQEQAVNVSVATAGAAERYVLTVGPTAVDTAIAVGTDKNPAVAIALQGVAKDGYAAAADKTFTFINYALKAQASDDYSGATGYVFPITKDGKLVEDAAGVKTMTMSATGAAITAFTTNASGAAVKLDKGVYVVTAYNVVKTAGEALKIEQVGASQSFTVTDNQKIAEVKKNSNAEKLTSLDTSADIEKAFDVTFDGKSLKDWGGKVSVTFKYNKNDNTAYVVEAYVTVKNATTGDFTMTVPVDTLVKKGN